MFSDRSIYDPERKNRVDGKNVIITGGNTGIGFATARELLQRGANVTILCRNQDRMKEALIQLNLVGSGRVKGEILDLKSFDSVKTTAEGLLKTMTHIDICIFNAGIMKVPLELCEGLESQQCVNHFSHFLFLKKIYSLLEAAPGRPRVISLSSSAHAMGNGDLKYWKRYEGEKEYLKHCSDPLGSFVPYGNSKLANYLHMKKASENDPNIGFFAVHPGVVQTELGRYWNANANMFTGMVLKCAKPFCKTAQEGAQTSIFCSVDPELEKAENSGLYFADASKSPVKGVASNTSKATELANELWKISEKITKTEVT